MTIFKKIKLSEIAEFKNGLNYSKKDFGIGLKVINVKNFKDLSFIDFNDLDEIDSDFLSKDDALLKNDDVLFVRSNGNRELIGRSIFIQNLNQRVSHSAFTIRVRFFSPKVY